MLKHLTTLLLFGILFAAYIVVKPTATSPFVRVENGILFKNDKPYYFVGTNFWYGAILASEGEGGDRKRLVKELDFLKEIGVDNLRILVGADGANGITAKVEPGLQIAPGVYNDTILAGLDYLLFEMNKREMVAVLYLNNSWEWSGGYSQYLEWAGYGKAPVPAVDGWDAFMNHVQQFVKCDSATTLFKNHVTHIVTRQNRYTSKRYIDDPTIMAWQIGNEPRAFGKDNKVAFSQWMASVAAHIKQLDPNHLVSTGSEGTQGCEQDIALFEQIHADPNIDYMNIHVWPYNWQWAHKDSLSQHLENAKTKTAEYINEHLFIAQKYNKPVVLEEFGFPRDDFRFSTDASTLNRDSYYESIFNQIGHNESSKGVLAGCNFWAWGGFAQPSGKDVFWNKGDDYTGDPAQEEQGLNSVFVSDTTIPLIKRANETLKHKYLN